MSAVFNKILIALFGIYWLWLILTNYFREHPYYQDSLSHFQFWGLVVLYIFIYLGYLIYRYGFKGSLKIELKNFTPLKASLLILANIFLIFNFYALSDKVKLFQGSNFILGNFHFLGKILFIFLAIFLIIAVAYVVGTWLLDKFEFQFTHQFEKFLFSVGIGIVLEVFGLLVLGALHLINIWVCWIIFGLVLGSGYKRTWQFLQLFLKQGIKKELSFFSFELLLWVFLGVMIATNISTLVRPMPIGWDEISWYSNAPQLMAHYQSLIPGNGAYSWSLLMTLGFTMFQQANVTFFIAWIGGFLALLALYHFGARFMSKQYAVLLPTLFYSLPTVFFQASQDLKVDLGLFFIAVLCLIAFFKWKDIFFSSPSENIQPKNSFWWRYQWLLLCFFLAGFGFSIKPTIFMLIAALGFILCYVWAKWEGLILSSAALVGVMTLTDSFAFGGIVFSHTNQTLVLLGSLVVAVVCGILILKKYPQDLKQKLLALILSLFCLLLPFSPWLVKHYSEARSFALTSLFFGKALNSPIFELESINKVYQEKHPELVPATLTPEETKFLQKDTGYKEELQRYIGYSGGVIRYLGLPWNQTMNINIKGTYVDLGFVLLLFLPILLLFIEKRSNLLLNLLGVLFFWGTTFIVTHPALSLHQWLNNLSSVPSALIMGLILVIPSLILYVFAKEKVFSWVLLGIFIVTYWSLWTFMGTGIIWYGWPGFIALLIILGALLSKLEEQKENFSHSLVFISKIVLVLWFSASLIYRLDFLDVPVFAQYKIGKINAQQAQDVLLPAYKQATDVINSETKSLLYRVGTFLPYFIKENDRRTVGDAQLDAFMKIWFPHKNKQATIDKLKMGGFQYILLDLNTATIDRTPEQTLAKKFEQFLEFTNDNPALEIIATDLHKIDAQSQQEMVGGKAIAFLEAPGKIKFSLIKQGLALYSGKEYAVGSVIVWRIH